MIKIKGCFDIENTETGKQEYVCFTTYEVDESLPIPDQCVWVGSQVGIALPKHVLMVSRNGGESHASFEVIGRFDRDQDLKNGIARDNSLLSRSSRTR